MLSFLYATTMLALEAKDVVALRLTKLAAGGWDAVAEVELMMGEKVVALCETVQDLCIGATPTVIVSRYRERVAANVARLGTAPETR